MKPLNQQERLRTYLLFSILFLVGIGIVSIPFFSMYHLAKKQNEIVQQDTKKSREEMKAMKDQENTQREFIVEMNKIKKEIDKMEIPDENLDVISGSVSIYIQQAMTFVHNDTSWRSSMYNNILDTYSELKEDKFKKILAQENTSDELAETKRQLIMVQNKLKECNQDLKAAKRKPIINPKNVGKK